MSKTIKSQEQIDEFADSIVDQISDDVNTEVADLFESYGLTKDDVDRSSDKFCQTISDEIEKRLQQQIKEFKK